MSKRKGTTDLPGKATSHNDGKGRRVMLQVGLSVVALPLLAGCLHLKSSYRCDDPQPYKNSSQCNDKQFNNPFNNRDFSAGGQLGSGGATSA
jgi:hypothetical protein